MSDSAPIHVSRCGRAVKIAGHAKHHIPGLSSVFGFPTAHPRHSVCFYARWPAGKACIDAVA